MQTQSKSGHEKLRIHPSLFLSNSEPFQRLLLNPNWRAVWLTVQQLLETGGQDLLSLKTSDTFLFFSSSPCFKNHYFNDVYMQVQHYLNSL